MVITIFYNTCPSLLLLTAVMFNPIKTAAHLEMLNVSGTTDQAYNAVKSTLSESSVFHPFAAQYAACCVHHGWQQRRSLQCYQKAVLC